MNEVLTLGGLDDYNEEQLEIVLANVLSAKMKRCELKITQMFDKMSKLEEKQDIMKDGIMLEIEKRDATYQQQMDVAINAVRLTGRNNKREYVKQTDLGKKYVVNISSVSMGTLLRLSGIAWKNRKNTTPKMNDGEKYCIIDPITDKNGNIRESYSWHIKNCMDLIDEWLKDNDYYEEFYSIGCQDEMKEYIKTLANKHGVAC